MGRSLVSQQDIPVATIEYAVMMLLRVHAVDALSNIC